MKIATHDADSLFCEENNKYKNNWLLQVHTYTFIGGGIIRLWIFIQICIFNSNRVDYLWFLLSKVSILCYISNFNFIILNRRLKINYDPIRKKTCFKFLTDHFHNHRQNYKLVALLSGYVNIWNRSMTVFSDV